MQLGKRVPGVGKVPADVMFVGEAPGFSDEQRGRPFSGKMGVELERYCEVAGINFWKSYRSTVVKYRPTTRSKSGSVKPTREDIARDEHELVAEIEKVRPWWIVAVGAVAARWLLGKGTFTSMEACHGFAYPTVNYRAAEASADADVLVGVVHPIVVPVYSPAAGLHSPQTQPSIMWDFQQLGGYLSGRLPVVQPADRYPDPDYFEPHAGLRLLRDMPVAVDTEGLRGRVWGLSYSQTPGSAGVVRTTNRKMVQRMREELLS